MPLFKSREEDFERKFAHDEELRFRFVARNAKLLANWAAYEMGYDEARKSALCSEIIHMASKDHDFSDVNKKIKSLFDENGIEISEHIISQKQQKFYEEARQQVCHEE